MSIISAIVRYILFKENGAGILNVESDNEKLKRAGGG